MPNNSNVDLNELASQIKDQSLQRMSQEIRSIAKSLDDAKVASNTNMPVEVFSNYFVDYFLDVFEKDDDPNSKIDFNKIDQYVKVAGGYFNEVNLINNKGEIIDTIPSLYVNRDNVDVVAKENYIDGKMNRYISKNRSGYSSIAEAYITNELSHLDKSSTEEEDRIKHKQKWLDILNKYKPNNDIVDMDKETYNNEVRSMSKEDQDKLQFDYED